MKNKFILKIISFTLAVIVFLFIPLHTYAISASIESAITEHILKIMQKGTGVYVNVPILMYHHLDEEANSSTIITPETFESHIKALTDNGYVGISFEELGDYVENDDAELPEKPIIITFDDGYSSNYEIAYPILQKYGMKATIFVIGILVGKDSYIDTDSGEYPIIPHFCYEQANEMIESGLISIQSHSYDMHRFEKYEKLLNREFRYGILPLDNESEEEYIIRFKDDYMLSKTEIETETQTEVITYAYPHGKYTELSEILLREMGVKITLTVNRGNNKIIKGNPETLYLLNRYNISNIPSERLLEILNPE